MHLKKSWKEVQKYNERHMVCRYGLIRMAHLSGIYYIKRHTSIKLTLLVVFSNIIFLFSMAFFLSIFFYVIGNFNTFFDIMWCVNCETICYANRTKNWVIIIIYHLVEKLSYFLVLLDYIFFTMKNVAK